MSTGFPGLRGLPFRMPHPSKNQNEQICAGVSESDPFWSRSDYVSLPQSQL